MQSVRRCDEHCLKSITLDISSLLKQPEPALSSRSTSTSPTLTRKSTSPPTSIDACGQSPSTENPSLAGSKRRKASKRVNMSKREPAKKQSKWKRDEDQLMLQLRGRSVPWDEISGEIPGRTPVSCRLHYQNYLERRAQWNEERYNKLARLYERFKSEMWAKIAEEMVMPWRAIEAMHWMMGEEDMCRRAGVVAYSTKTSFYGLEAMAKPPSPPRGTAYTTIPPLDYTHSGNAHTTPSGPTYSASNITGAPQMVPSPHSGNMPLATDQIPRSMLPAYGADSISPIDMGSPLQRPQQHQMLPSILEMTAGMSPYGGSNIGPPPNMFGMHAGPGPVLPVYQINSVDGPRVDLKRRASTEMGRGGLTSVRSR